MVKFEWILLVSSHTLIAGTDIWQTSEDNRYEFKFYEKLISFFFKFLLHVYSK